MESARVGPVALWSSLRPGSRLLVKYRGEDLWHERVLGWPVDGRSWVVVTPDGNIYCEELDAEDVAGLRAFGARGRKPRGFGAALYRFDTDDSCEVAENTVRKWIRACYAEAAAETARRGLRLMPADNFDYWLNWMCEPVSMRGVLHRVSSKGRAADPEGEARPALPLDSPGGTPGDPPSPGDRLPAGEWRRPAMKDVPPGGGQAAVEDSTDASVWIVWSPFQGLTVGDEATMPLGARVEMGDHALLPSTELPGEAIHLRRVRRAELADMRDSRLRELRDLMPPPGGVPPGDGEVTPKGEECEDTRTLSIVYDAQGERFRSWKSVAPAVDESFYDDWPIEGPRTCLWLIKHVERSGGSPMQWYHRYLAESKISPTDRSAYELQVLCRIFEHAGSYDMLNLPSLACFEAFSRRWQLLLDANARDPGEPRFEDEEFWSGLQQRTLGIAPPLTSHVAKKAKEKVEIEAHRAKARELRAPPAKPPGGPPKKA